MNAALPPAVLEPTGRDDSPVRAAGPDPMAAGCGVEPTDPWLDGAGRHGAQLWVANAPCRVESIRLGGRDEPVTLLDAPPGAWASYTASPRSAWLDYAVHEARRMLDGPPTEPAPGGVVATRAATRAATATLSALLPTVMRLPGALLQAGGLDRCAVLANRLTSTNLHPQLPAEAWAHLTDEARTRWPQRPLVLRNVCSAVTPGLEHALVQLGWTLVPARQVWLCDPADATVWKRNNVRNDKRLVFRPEVQWMAAADLTAADLPALRTLFRAVFHDKHSQLNPDFTPAYFDLCRQGGALELLGLKHEGAWVGVMGLDARHGWLTTPLLGYDTQRPQSLALYRRLMGRLLLEARDRGLRLHYSSGADAFKASRGGVAALEYTALYLPHLPRHRRLAAQAFARLMQAAVPRALAKVDTTL